MKIFYLPTYSFFTGVLLILLTAVPGALAGPYAPAAGEVGSTALYMNDTEFTAWATGWTNYLPGAEVDSIWQTPEKALGKAAGTSSDILSLGRGGRITLTFDSPIADGAGWDFAVFENSFSDTFLELAYVEVSSNGIDFFRFQNDSLTSTPVNGFGSVDPTDINGLAGKYRLAYGTPFDLADLDGLSPLLDVSCICWVRILDIVGDGTYTDSSGDIIYDPYPTTGTAGFDLEAIGVLNSASVPIPGALILFGSGVALLLGIRLRREN